MMQNRFHAQRSLMSHRQQGLTLVETMVAITLGLILTIGIVQFFVGSKRSYQMQESSNALQENGRYAMRAVTDGLRLADHWGGVDGADVNTSLPSVSGFGGCDNAWILNAAEALKGYEGASTSPLPNGCIDDADYVPDSDVFAVRYADGDYVDTATVKSGTNPSEIWVRSAVGRRAALFKGADIANLPADLYDAADEDATGLYNYRYRITAYFLRPCTTKSGTVCSNTDDNGSPLPALTRLTLNGTRLEEQTLVSGVEQMQLEYGMDTNQDTNVEYYATATEVEAANQWNRVSSVRISLVVRGEERSKLPDTNTYTLPSGYTFTPTGDAQYYPRKVFTTVVQIRNRSRA